MRAGATNWMVAATLLFAGASAFSQGFVNLGFEDAVTAHDHF